MKVQQLIDALQAIPESHKALDVMVYSDEFDGFNAPIDGVYLCNVDGSRVGLLAPRWFPDPDDLLFDRETECANLELR